MSASSSTYLEHRSPELLQPLKHEACALCTVPDGPDLALHLNDDEDRTKPPGAPYSMGSGRTEPGRAEPTPRGRGTLRPAPGGPAPLAPTATPRGPRDGPARTVRQAKRARVENIIRDMVGSSFSSSRDPDPEDGRGDQGPRDRPQGPIQAQRAGRSDAVGCWTSEELAVKSRLQNTKGHPLLTSRSSGGLPPEDWEPDSDTPREETPSGETCVFGGPPPGGEHNRVLPQPPCSGPGVPLHRRAWGRSSKVRVPTGGGGRRAAAVMADILKYELSRAVSVSVDSVFSSMPLLGPPPAAAVLGRSAGAHPPHRAPLHHSRLGAPAGPPPHQEEVCGGPLPEVQTQALSLVVQRPPQAGSTALCRPPHQHPAEPGSPSSRCMEQRSAHQGSGGLPGGATDPVGCTQTPSEGAGGGPRQEVPGGACKLGSKVRCKVNSRSVRGAQSARHFAVEPVFLEGLCVPLEVRAGARGPQSVLMSNLFSLNDGLTTSHLKKAKLMFFYTRYPSSLVLKTFFHDVQFTRCITSQLIKWFSNFREFYYIQMEKQARQALAQGVTHAAALAVGRESELFRALSTHYNKASDFQVPERFLEVAGITLREFYQAVSLGRDVDPSWKKPIYKVICKLDSSVPEEFKTHYPD